jgi:hypothetical protein
VHESPCEDASVVNEPASTEAETRDPLAGMIEALAKLSDADRERLVAVLRT